MMAGTEGHTGKSREAGLRKSLFHPPGIKGNSVPFDGWGWDWPAAWRNRERWGISERKSGEGPQSLLPKQTTSPNPMRGRTPHASSTLGLSSLIHTPHAHRSVGG